MWMVCWHISVDTGTCCGHWLAFLNPLTNCDMWQHGVRHMVMEEWRCPVKRRGWSPKLSPHSDSAMVLERSIVVEILCWLNWGVLQCHLHLSSPLSPSLVPPPHPPHPLPLPSPVPSMQKSVSSTSLPLSSLSTMPTTIASHLLEKSCLVSESVVFLAQWQLFA